MASSFTTWCSSKYNTFTTCCSFFFFLQEEEEEIIMEEEEEEMLNISKLPQDIITEILSWLPGKSLVSSFKFVCKSWRTVIQDPVFVKMHLNRGGGSNTNNSLIRKVARTNLFQLHPPFNLQGEGEGVITTTNLYFPSLLTSFRFSGSCNGLLCLTAKNDECIVLVNPCTRKYKILPRYPIQLPKYKILPRYPIQLPPKSGTPRAVLYGFGCCYNNSTDDDDNIIIEDYKVIRIVSFDSFSNGEYSLLHYVDIYYMSSDSWRRETTRFRDYPYFMSEQQSGVFVNGALHWMGYNNLVRPGGESWDTIVSFHVRDEEFRLVPVPRSCEPTDDYPFFRLHDIILMNMKGCLSMILFSPGGNNRMNVDLEIWVMKEYGIKESWIKEFVIKSSNLAPPSPRELSGFITSKSSNAHVLKGDQILIEGWEEIPDGPDQYNFRETQVLYDIDKRKIYEDLEMVGVPNQSNINQVGYNETLVSLKSSLLP